MKKAETVPGSPAAVAGEQTLGGMTWPTRKSEVASKGSAGRAGGPGAADDDEAAAIADGSMLSGQTHVAINSLTVRTTHWGDL